MKMIMGTLIAIGLVAGATASVKAESFAEHLAKIVAEKDASR